MNQNDELKFNVHDFLASVLTHWKMIFFCTFLTGLISALIALFVLPEVYSTSASMLISRNPLTSDYTPQTLSIPSMQPILTSDDILQKVMESSGILEEKEDLTLTSFRRNLDLDIFIEQDTNVAKNYSPLIRLNASASSPEMAKKIVDQWVILAAQRLNEVLSQDLAVNVRIVESSHRESFDRLQELQQEILYFEGEIPIIEAEIDYLSKKRTEFMGELRDTMVEIARTEAMVREYASEYDKEANIISLKRTITDDALWQGLIQSDQRLHDVLNSALGNEVLNPIYTELRSKYITSNAELMGLNQQKTAQQEALIEFDDQIDVLNRKVNQMKLNLEELEKAYALVEGKFDKYLESKVQLDIEERLAKSMLDSEMGQFRFARAATWGVVNPQRVSPQRSLIVLTALFLSFWVFVFLAFLIELLKKAGIFDSTES